MRLRKAVETLWEISPLPSSGATGKTAGNTLKALAKSGFHQRSGSRFLAHPSLHMAAKNDAADSDDHRQIRAEVYTHESGSNLRLAINQGGFRMAIQAHLVELERKHKSLENELHEALIHLSTDDLQIAELKRRKLMVKDQIERLKQSANGTLH
jgi:hypothetical protein